MIIMTNGRCVLPIGANLFEVFFVGRDRSFTRHPSIMVMAAKRIDMGGHMAQMAAVGGDMPQSVGRL